MQAGIATAANARAAALWRDADTVLLDMDGTLLDLAFDNWFWLEAVPRCLARHRAEATDVVRRELFAHFDRVRGTLDWYCLDYWSRELALDLRELKAASSHRIRFLPGAREFLAVARRSGKRLVLVTNAHGETLAVKKAVSGLGACFDRCVSSHEFGCPKESAAFWPALRAAVGFDPARTLFVDDSQPVLDAAAHYGLAGIVGVTRPDSQQPARDVAPHTAIEGVAAFLG
ncbi:MAG: GMP/IMP nucleotidase [Gammaproteobacteria bacterium]|nr:GMP/IMP nucleotidase [Gammaproteobacteria bacterium]